MLSNTIHKHRHADTWASWETHFQMQIYVNKEIYCCRGSPRGGSPGPEYTCTHIYISIDIYIHTDPTNIHQTSGNKNLSLLTAAEEAPEATWKVLHTHTQNVKQQNCLSFSNSPAHCRRGSPPGDWTSPMHTHTKCQATKLSLFFQFSSSLPQTEAPEVTRQVLRTHTPNVKQHTSRTKTHI